MIEIGKRYTLNNGCVTKKIKRLGSILVEQGKDSGMLAWNKYGLCITGQGTGFNLDKEYLKCEQEEQCEQEENKMTHKEMIDVITHHMKGGKVELSLIELDRWYPATEGITWNFKEYKYRIIKSKTTEDMKPGDTAKIKILGYDFWNGAKIAMIPDRQIVLIEDFNKHKAYKTTWSKYTILDVEID